MNFNVQAMGKGQGKRQRWGGREGRVRGRGGWERRMEGRKTSNISQSKPLKYKDKEGMFFSELERNYESMYVSR
jgi:hypothetical protein